MAISTAQHAYLKKKHIDRSHIVKESEPNSISTSVEHKILNLSVFSCCIVL